MRFANKLSYVMRVLRGTAEDGLSEINSGGKGVVNFVDVGSVGGLPLEWRLHAAKIRFLLNFEPRDEPSRTDNIITMNVALWSEECVRDFYIYKQRSGSSLFMQNYDYVRENFDRLKHHGPSHLANTWFGRSKLVRTETVKCRTFDDIVNECLPGIPLHFIKIDAQGAEYQILKGAEKTLVSSCVGLKLELFTLPMYKGIHLLPEVDDYLRSKGFRLTKKFPAHGTYDAAGDYLFMKENAENSVTKTIREVYDL